MPWLSWNSRSTSKRRWQLRRAPLRFITRDRDIGASRGGPGIEVVEHDLARPQGEIGDEVKHAAFAILV
jgi:hypothetical protein